MKTPTLILSPRHTDSSQILWQTAINKGWNVERIMSFRPPVDFACDEPIIYGEPVFNQLMCEHLKIRLCEVPDNFLTIIPKDLTGRNIDFMPAREARKIKNRVFMKPPNAKTFLAGVFESGDGLPTTVPDGEMILVQDVVHFVHEYRFFVGSPLHITGSSYIIFHAHAKSASGWIDPPEIHDSAKSYFENECYPYLRGRYPKMIESIVIDIGYIEGVGWKVIEANDINASGMYNCDPDVVIQALWMSTRRIG